MLFGKREPRLAAARRRGLYRPFGENLEARCLLAIDVGGTAPPILPNVATVPFGVELAGGTPSGGAGFSVSNLGDVNLDGFDDFLVGGPTVANAGDTLTLGSGLNSQAYLIFGSREVDAGNFNWGALIAQQRVGDLAQLGNSANTQQNPFNNQPGFPFEGITFFTSQNANSLLGASVTSLGIINGAPAFLIGALGANDATGANPGTGRAYLVYGGTNLNNVPNQLIDLDNNQAGTGVTVVTFTSTIFGAQTGRAVAGVGDVITDGIPDLAIGAPAATIPGSGLPNGGLVYLISGAALPTTTTTVDLLTVGQANGTAGAIFVGEQSGDLAGFSIAAAGSVAGAQAGGGLVISDFLIGAPSENIGAGAAYLIYGSSTLPALATPISGVNAIFLSRIGDPSVAGNITGAVFLGATAGDSTGFAVSSAGDFNNDGFGDIMIGSPTANAGAGSVTLFYGQPAAGNLLLGDIPLSDIPSTFPSVTFTGSGAGALAGYSLSLVGRINNDPISEISIGSPGFNNLAGAAYLIPGNVSLLGTFSLTTAESQPMAATLITFSAPGTVTPAFFGSSVSGRLTQLGQSATADNDLVADFIIGAAGYALDQTRGLDGGVLILEGAFVPLQIPIVTVIITQIGVGQPFGPFTVNATTPDALQIFVFSNADIDPPFRPVTDIDPTTILINGVAFPDATIAQDPVDENDDGIPDAIITISPRSNIGLTNNTTIFTISGLTLSTSPIPNRQFVGQATITVSGGGGGGGGGGVSSLIPPGLRSPTEFIPPLGERFVPQLAALSRLDYVAIPLSVAINQYKPERGFALRQRNFFGKKQYGRVLGGRFDDQGSGVNTLGRDVFTRGFFKPGKKVVFRHPQRVVPTNRQTERFS